MNKLFNKDFLKFVFGFVGIILFSLILSAFVSKADSGNQESVNVTSI